MRGSCSPGALLASITPGSEVAWMAILPFLAMIVPGAGGVFPAGPSALLSADAVEGALAADLPGAAAVPAAAIDSISE